MFRRASYFAAPLAREGFAKVGEKAAPELTTEGEKAKLPLTEPTVGEKILLQLAAIFKRGLLWFDKERRRGKQSPFVVGFWGATIMYAIYKLMTKYVIPWKRSGIERMMMLKQPMVDSHNAMFNLPPYGSTNGTEPNIVVADNTDRPQLVAIESVEQAPDPNRLIVFQMREFDPDSKADVFVRSLHYAAIQTTSEMEESKRAANPYFEKVREISDATQDIKERAAEGPKAFFKGGKAKKEEESTFYEYTHGMMKCSAITPTNNCVPQTSPELESLRKMLVSLGPLFAFRNPLVHTYVPRRWHVRREIPSEALVLGLGHGSALVQWLHRHMPHLILDVVERDGGVVRVARRYFGFQDDRDGISLFIEDPFEFVRRSTVKKKGRYDIIFLDCVDEKGQIPRQYARLEFLTNLRESLTDRGIAVCNIPNEDPRILSSVVNNWRMAFDGRTVVLLHCTTQQNTVLMTFNDQTPRGHIRYSEAGSVDEFKDLCTPMLKHFQGRINFDLLGELNESSWQQLVPGKQYTFGKREPPKPVTMEQFKNLSGYDTSGLPPGVQRKGPTPAINMTGI